MGQTAFIVSIPSKCPYAPAITIFASAISFPFKGTPQNSTSTPFLIMTLTAFMLHYCTWYRYAFSTEEHQNLATRSLLSKGEKADHSQQNSQSQLGPQGISIQGRGFATPWGIFIGLEAKIGAIATGLRWHILLMFDPSGIGFPSLIIWFPGCQVVGWHFCLG